METIMWCPSCGTTKRVVALAVVYSEARLDASLRSSLSPGMEFAAEGWYSYLRLFGLLFV